MILTKYDEIMNEISLTPEAKERIIDNIADSVYGSKASGTSSDKEVRMKRVRIRKYLTAAACVVLLIAGTYGISRTDVFNKFAMDMGGSDSGYEFEEESATAEESEAPRESEENNDYGAGGELADSDAPEASADENTAESVPNANGSAPAANIEEDLDDAAADNDLDAKAFDGKNTQSTWNVTEFESSEELSEYLGFEISSPEFDSLNEGYDCVTYRAYGDYMGEIVYTFGDSENYYRKGIGSDDVSGDYNDYDQMAEFDGEKRSGTLKGNKGKYVLAIWTDIDGYAYAAYVEKGMNESDWFSLIDSSK